MSGEQLVTELLEGRKVVVLLGAGGVGKTSIAAALAIAAARRGLRCCALTIDPSRRLADALGLVGGTGEPVEVSGPWPGTLHAAVLDTRSTFEGLIRRNVGEEGRAETILKNPIYRALADELGGTTEYMAAERLLELVRADRFDLVVVDTPPAREAIDFLRGPGRLASFFDNRVLRALLIPGRATLGAASIASRILLRTIGRVAGGEVVADTIEFFRAIEGTEKGFRGRALEVSGLLASDATAYVLVAAGRASEVSEAHHLGDELARLGRHVDLLVANRDLGLDLALELVTPTTAGLEALLANLELLRHLEAGERSAIDQLAVAIGEPPLLRVAALEGDVHDLEGLVRLADALD